MQLLRFSSTVIVKHALFLTTFRLFCPLKVTDERSEYLSLNIRAFWTLYHLSNYLLLSTVFTHIILYVLINEGVLSIWIQVHVLILIIHSLYINTRFIILQKGMVTIYFIRLSMINFNRFLTLGLLFLQPIRFVEGHWKM